MAKKESWQPTTETPCQYLQPLFPGPRPFKLSSSILATNLTVPHTVYVPYPLPAVDTRSRMAILLLLLAVVGGACAASSPPGASPPPALAATDLPPAALLLHRALTEHAASALAGGRRLRLDDHHRRLAAARLTELSGLARRDPHRALQVSRALRPELRALFQGSGASLLELPVSTRGSYIVKGFYNGGAGGAIPARDERGITRQVRFWSAAAKKFYSYEARVYGKREQ